MSKKTGNKKNESKSKNKVASKPVKKIVTKKTEAKENLDKKIIEKQKNISVKTKTKTKRKIKVSMEPWMIFAIGFVIVLGLSILISKFLPEPEKIEFQEISFVQFQEILERDEKNIIYFGQDGCGYCKEAEPLLFKLEKEYEITIYYVDVTTLTYEDDMVLASLSNEFSNGVGTPTVVVVKEGYIVDDIIGLTNYETYKNFIIVNMFGEVNNTIKENNENKKLLSITYVEFEKLMSDKKDFVIYFGQQGCPACEMAEPSLLKLKTDLGIDVYYNDVNMLSENEFYSLLELSDAFSEGIYTPTVIKYENGKEVNYVVGALDYDGYKELIEK